MNKIRHPKAYVYIASGITSTSHDNNMDADYNCLSDCSPVKGHSGSNGEREGHQETGGIQETGGLTPIRTSAEY